VAWLNDTARLSKCLKKLNGIFVRR